VLLLVLALASGCAYATQTTGPYVPRGGVDAHNATLDVDDVWVEAPHGVAAGSRANLRLSISNEYGARDALVGVRAPFAAHVQLRLGGRDVGRIPIPPYASVNLQRGRSAGVRLDGFRRAVEAGRWVSIRLLFSRSAPIALQVTLGPLGADHLDASAPVRAAPSRTRVERCAGERLLG
jgi:hypothetical protein